MKVKIKSLFNVHLSSFIVFCLLLLTSCLLFSEKKGGAPVIATVRVEGNPSAISVNQTTPQIIGSNGTCASA